MGFTDELVEEHDHILVMLQVLQKMWERLETGGHVAPDDVERSIDFIRNYADRFHHSKEEDLLFPALGATGLPTDGGPVAVMLTEHEEGRGYVAGMEDALGRYRAGDQAAAAEIAANARQYAGLLFQHINKENQVLYPMAESRIEATEKARLAQQFEEIDREAATRGVQAAYVNIMRDLAFAYLK